jgi:hypothetical protein
MLSSYQQSPASAFRGGTACLFALLGQGLQMKKKKKKKKKKAPKNGRKKRKQEMK